MSAHKGQWKFSRDIHRLARQAGYPEPESLLFFEYHVHGLSMREAGDMLGITGPAVRARLLKWVPLGWKFRPRGGNRVNPGLRSAADFGFRCDVCDRTFKGTCWNHIIKEMQNHECKKEK